MVRHHLGIWTRNTEKGRIQDLRIELKGIVDGVRSVYLLKWGLFSWSTSLTKGTVLLQASPGPSTPPLPPVSWISSPPFWFVQGVGWFYTPALHNPIILPRICPSRVLLFPPVWHLYYHLPVKQSIYIPKGSSVVLWIHGCPLRTWFYPPWGGRQM